MLSFCSPRSSCSSCSSFFFSFLILFFILLFSVSTTLYIHVQIILIFKINILCTFTPPFGTDAFSSVWRDERVGREENGVSNGKKRGKYKTKQMEKEKYRQIDKQNNEKERCTSSVPFVLHFLLLFYR